MYDVAVIGGGISGLTAAHRLQLTGHNVVLLERQVRTGGKALSTNTNGFLMEHGPSSVNGASNEVAALSSNLELDDQRCDLGPNVKKRYLVKDGKLAGIATHPLAFFTSNYLSPRARLGLLAEIMQPVGDDPDESIAAFAARRFGQEFADRVVDPLIGGLFAANAANLSVSAVFPKLQEFEHIDGSVVLGALRGKRRGGRMPGRRLYSWRNGIGTLTTALSAKLKKVIKTGANVRNITPLSSGYRIEMGSEGQVGTRAVIIATQPHITAGLLEKLDSISSEAAASVHAPPISVVFMGYRREQIAHPLDGIGSLSPSCEKSLLSGILFNSTMFSDRAPKGCVALTAYIIGERSPEIVRAPLEEQSKLVQEEFGKLLGAKGDPLVSRIHHWQRGLPQPRIGHQKHMARLLEAEQRWPGLFITGNYFKSPSVGNCVAAADETAERVQGFLGNKIARSRVNKAC